MRERVVSHLTVVALVVWVLVTSTAAQLLAAEPGPFSERPFAKSLVIGGAVALPLILVDIARRPRKFWRWGVGLWGLILWLSAWSGAFGDDSDIDQIIGWGVMLGGLIGLPLIVGSAIGWTWNRLRNALRRRPRRWRVRLSEHSLHFERRTKPGD